MSQGAAPTESKTSSQESVKNSNSGNWKGGKSWEVSGFSFYIPLMLFDIFFKAGT